MAVDTSRDAVERLAALMDKVRLEGLQGYCWDTAATLRALLARAEAAGAAHVTSQLALKQALDQRDAAIAERDRLAEALAQARREGMEAAARIAQRVRVPFRDTDPEKYEIGIEIAAAIRSAAGEEAKE